MVVIIDCNEIAKLQVTSSAGRFASNALHCTAVTKEAIGVVAHKLVAWFVEDGSSVSLGNCETNSI